jgi:hypothetical protein
MMIRLLLLTGLWMSNSVQAQQPTISKAQCRAMAEAMIAEGKKNIARSERPEDAAMLRTLTHDWQQRLDAGEDPCAVYSDIFKASTRL